MKVNVYKVEKSFNNLQWKRTSEVVTIGTIKEMDDYNTVKMKCAAAFDISTPSDELVLTRCGAKIDPSAFRNLGQFLGCLSAQQRSKASFGVGIEVSCIQYCFR